LVQVKVWTEITALQSSFTFVHRAQKKRRRAPLSADGISIR
jgi:hypothetical protein